MAKMLKPLIVLNLLAGIAALVLGIKIFQDREIIKDRTIKLQRSLETVGKNLTYENADGLATRLQVYERMGDDLGKVEAHASTRQRELNDTRDELAETKSELAETITELNATKVALDTANREIERLENDLTRTNEQLADARGRIDALSVEISGLKTQIADLNDTITAKETAIDQLTAELTTKQTELTAVRIELETCLGGTTAEEVQGKAANVIAVNREWNFIVVDKGSRDFFAAGMEPVIGRGQQYIGKGKISIVEDNISVVDVEIDSLEPGVTLQLGDYILFPPDL